MGARRAHRAAPPALALALLLLMAARAFAMYEDQAGTFDWHRQHIGEVLHAGHSPGRDRFYVATAQSLVAAVSAGDGSIAWRRAYNEEDPLGQIITLAKPAAVVAVSGGGRYVRAWEPARGALKWEAPGGAPAAAAGAAAGARGSAAVAAVDTAQVPAVAVHAPGTVQLLSADKGEVIWTAAGPEASAEPGSVNLVMPTPATDYMAGDKVLAVTMMAGGQTGHARLYNVSAGEEQAHSWDIFAEEPLSLTNMVLTPKTLFAATEDGASICSTPIEWVPAAGNVFTCHLLRLTAGCEGDCGGRMRIVAAGGDGTRAFVAAPGAGVLLLHADFYGSQVVKAFPGATAASQPFPGADGAPLAAVFGAPTDAGVPVTVVDATTGEAKSSYTLPAPAPPHPVHGPPAHVTAAFPASVAAGAPAAPPPALLVVWSDHQLSASKGSELAWAREEALASVQSSLFIDLPAARGAAKEASCAAGGGAGAKEVREAAGGGGGGVGGGLVPESTRRWVRMQYLAVLVQFKLASDEDRLELVTLREELSNKNLMYRDANGFRKLIVVLTSAGKALALHNGDGRVVWAARYDPAAPPTHLLRWRAFHDLAHAPQLALLRAGAAAAAKESNSDEPPLAGDEATEEARAARKSYASVLDGGTGRELDRIEVAADVDKVVPLPEPLHDGTAEQFCYLLVSPPPAAPAAGAPAGAAPCPPPPPAALGAALLPGGGAAAAHLESLSSKVAFWREFGTAAAAASGKDSKGGKDGCGGGWMAGYGFDSPADAKAVASGKGGEARLVWSLALPGKLLAVAARQPGEPMHSAVKVLGDRSLKFKYTNPNVVFVAVAGAMPAPPAPGARSRGHESKEVPSVTAMLVNAVDGAVLHQQAHPGAVGPVQAVASEHWFVYSFLDTATARQQATVMEMYDATPRDLSLGTVLAAVLGGEGSVAAAGSVSDDSSTPLQVLSQSYFLQVRCKLMSVTQTLSGINIKQLLMGTVTDQVYAMDKRYLDPRRPLRVKPTPEEAEERLPPYTDLLPFAPLHYATYDKEVARLRAVEAQPAGLESTTLVLAYGADLFYTRLAPARHFDSLEDDFNYGLLVVGLLALAGGTLFARRYSSETTLQAQWK